MRATIVVSVMGVFGFGEENKLIDKALFKKDQGEIAGKLEEIETGRVVEEMVVLIKRLRDRGYDLFLFEKPEIAKNAFKKLKVKVDVDPLSQAGELLRRDLEKFAVDVGFVKKPEEVHEWMHKISMELTKMRVRRALEKRDLIVAQAIQTIDDLDRTLNLFMSRITEWYGLHFPELNRLIHDHGTYVRLVANLGVKDNLTIENLEKEGLSKTKIKKIAVAAKSSMGAELDEKDIEKIQLMCKTTLKLYEIRRSMEGYLGSVIKEVSPNIRTLAGSLLGARIIALAGGLNNLAKMPASTIQVLGAEKALFRALRTGAPPPKHGIIFQHPFVREAKRWQRGKASRALAGKLAIAARIDAYSGKDRGDRLCRELDRRIKEISEKFKKPRRRLKHGRRG